MKRESEREVLGVVGGMGPLASAEFLKTVYECGIGEREQEAPVVVMYSDPTFPDRTDAFLAGQDEPLLSGLTAALRRLSEAGASRFVLCCMTIHYLLPRLPADLRARVISLLDVIFDELGRQPRRHLLICSSGTRRLGLFENHEQWGRRRSQIVMPDDEDQERIHRELIYPIKKRPDWVRLTALLDALMRRYEVDSFIAGCSEIHWLAKQLVAGGAAWRCLDPLMLIAQAWGEPVRENER